MRICSCCNVRPADSSRRNYCRECARTYQRDYARRKRGCKPRPAPPRPLEAHEKFCPHCKRILERDNFYKETRAGDGLSSIYKGCEAFRQSAKYYRNIRRNRRKQRVRSAAFRANNPGYNARVCLTYARRRKARKLEAVLMEHSI